LLCSYHEHCYMTKMSGCALDLACPYGLLACTCMCCCCCQVLHTT
jgi:hypothetical protein